MNEFRITYGFIERAKTDCNPTAFQRKFFKKATNAARVARYMALSQKHTKRDGGGNGL